MLEDLVVRRAVDRIVAGVPIERRARDVPRSTGAEPERIALLVKGRKLHDTDLARASLLPEGADRLLSDGLDPAFGVGARVVVAQSRVGTNVGRIAEGADDVVERAFLTCAGVALLAVTLPEAGEDDVTGGLCRVVADDGQRAGDLLDPGAVGVAVDEANLDVVEAARRNDDGAGVGAAARDDEVAGVCRERGDRHRTAAVVVKAQRVRVVDGVRDVLVRPLDTIENEPIASGQRRQVLQPHLRLRSGVDVMHDNDQIVLIALLLPLLEGDNVRVGNGVACGVDQGKDAYFATLVGVVPGVELVLRVRDTRPEVVGPHGEAEAAGGGEAGRAGRRRLDRLCLRFVNAEEADEVAEVALGVMQQFDRFAEGVVERRAHDAQHFDRHRLIRIGRLEERDRDFAATGDARGIGIQGRVCVRVADVDLQAVEVEDALQARLELAAFAGGAEAAELKDAFGSRRVVALDDEFGLEDADGIGVEDDLEVAAFAEAERGAGGVGTDDAKEAGVGAADGERVGGEGDGAGRTVMRKIDRKRRRRAVGDGVAEEECLAAAVVAAWSSDGERCGLDRREQADA